jgi:hypothetical protein
MEIMKITNGQPWQNSSQNSVFWRGAKCHCQVAEFLLHKCKKLLKVRSSIKNIMPQQGKSILVSLPKHLARTQQHNIPRSSLSSQISVCAPAKRARTGLFLLRSVLLLSVYALEEKVQRVEQGGMNTLDINRRV